jgi:hypothetical protein
VELAEGQDLMRMRLPDVSSALLEHVTTHPAIAAQPHNTRRDNNLNSNNANPNPPRASGATNSNPSAVLPMNANNYNKNNNANNNNVTQGLDIVQANTVALRKLVLEAICGIFVEAECV